MNLSVDCGQRILERNTRLAPTHRSERATGKIITPKFGDRRFPNPVPALEESPRIRTESRTEEIEPVAVPAWKRGADLAIIALAFPVLLPLMLIVGLWVKVFSRGPVLFQQRRIGHGGQRFTMYKFRSMVPRAPSGAHTRHIEKLISSDLPLRKLDPLGDERLIPGGCIIRALGLDELPQILNILKGEMSLVGPRPCLPVECVHISGRHRKRFEVLPGITGKWQVNGKNSLTFRQMNDLDCEYVDEISLSNDLRILVATPLAILKQMGECLEARLLARRVDGNPVPRS